MAKFETSTAMNTIQGEVAMGVQSQRSGKRRKMSMARGGDGMQRASGMHGDLCGQRSDMYEDHQLTNTSIARFGL